MPNATSTRKVWWYTDRRGDAKSESYFYWLKHTFRSAYPSSINLRSDANSEGYFFTINETKYTFRYTYPSDLNRNSDANGKSYFLTIN